MLALAACSLAGMAQGHRPSGKAIVSPVPRTQQTMTLAGQRPGSFHRGDAKMREEKWVHDMLSKMTLEEKIAMIHAQSKFSSPGVKRLGVPEVWCTDGPHGIRAEVLWDEWETANWSNDHCVAFPALTCLSATWNPAMSAIYGKSIGEEARYRNKSVLLGPGVNIARTPLNGRSFEYMGEDPYLSGEMVVPYIRKVQEQGVAACVKHFCLNNNELHRHTTNAILSDRALYEIYLPAFEKAVKEGGAWSIMGSYNLYQDQHVCTNERLLQTILKGEWGFDGVVISDWGGVHNTDQAVRNGMDLEYGSWTNGLATGKKNAYDMYFLADPYLEGIKSGKYGEAELNDKVTRVLRMIYRTQEGRKVTDGSMCSEAHYKAARKIGAEGIVLLKNGQTDSKGAVQDGSAVLPIPAGKKVLVVGENAIKMMTVGGGSSSLKVEHEILPLDGIKERFGADNVSYERGYIGDVGGEYNGVTTGQDLKDSRSAEQLIADAVAAAKKADYVIFIGGLNKADHQDAEDFDREEYAMPYGQNAVIEALAAANQHLVVVNLSGNPVEMPWVKKVPAILQMWMLGSEAGHSLADVLSGDVNPSGHLPFTWYANLDQCGAHALGAYPGTKRLNADGSDVQIDGAEVWDLSYDEDIYVGYRWVDKKGVQPLFPFGYGLSYTTFSFSDLQVNEDGSTVSCTVTNTGNRAGAEVAQLYVGAVPGKGAAAKNAKAAAKAGAVPERPVRELKGFNKVYLKPGESKTVTFSLADGDFSYFDAAQHKWVAPAGEYTIAVGNSSRNLPLVKSVKR